MCARALLCPPCWAAYVRRACGGEVGTAAADADKDVRARHAAPFVDYYRSVASRADRERHAHKIDSKKPAHKSDSALRAKLCAKHASG